MSEYRRSEAKENYVGAPYNFVPLGTKVYRKKSITKHNEIAGLSGYVEYQVTAQTPIIVDGGDSHFYKNKDGKAAIPGSTMRGLVRSNMQILSQSSIVDDIADAKLMYRCVGGSASNANKKVYDKILKPKQMQLNGHTTSIARKIKGGYITNENGRYYIIPSVVQRIDTELEDMNYYIVRESDIIKDKFKGFESLRREPGILQYANNAYFEKKGRNYVGKPVNEGYYPRSEQVYYTLAGGGKEVAGISTESKKGYKKGTMIMSGHMNNKKAFYIIPEADPAKRFEIPNEDVESFKRDYKGREKQFSAAVGNGNAEISKETLIENARKFFDLPKDGETKPVFYTNYKGKWYFGYTTRLRVFYESSIYDGLTDVQKDNSLDYCKSLFGFTADEESYRSRLAFQETVIDSGKSEGKRESRVLAEPKPTSYLDYLIGKDGAPSAYRGEFQLRGMKQYWLHKAPVRGIMGKNENVGSSFFPYPQGSSFTGQIRFTNLSEEELGMLLWSLLLEKESQQNIGKGKPYGFGRVSISLKKLEIMDYAALYGSDALCLEPYQDQKAQCGEYIAKAKADMTAFLGKDVMTYPPVRDFFRMKNAEKMPDEEAIRYMHLSDKKQNLDSEYQERTKYQIMLDTIAVVLNEKARKAPKPVQNGGNGGYNGQKKYGNGGNGGYNGQKKYGNGNYGGQKKYGKSGNGSYNGRKKFGNGEKFQ